jgi:integrase
MSVARFMVFKGEETQDFLRSLELLRPKPGRTRVSRPCHKEVVIQAAIDKFGTAKNKRGVRAYRYYDELLNKTLVALAYYTAARSSELCGIKLSHIDFKKGSIRLYGKGNKERVVGICHRLRSALISYKQERPTSNSPYLLLSAQGRPLTKDAISRRYQRLRKYLGVSDFKAHSVRASAITDWLNEKKVPMSIVRDAVGHSNLSVTSLYARPTENDVIEAMRQL